MTRLEEQIIEVHKVEPKWNAHMIAADLGCSAPFVRLVKYNVTIGIDTEDEVFEKELNEE